MVNQTSIKYISGLLENPASLSDGDQSSIALFRQTFPYFAPVRYLAALDHHRKEPMSPEILSATMPYIGNWILFCEFLAFGTPKEGVETHNTQSQLEIPATIISDEVSITIEEPVVLIEEETVTIQNEPVSEITLPAAPTQNESEEQNETEEVLPDNNSNQQGAEIRLSRKQRRQAAYLEQRRLALEQQQVKNVVTQEIKSPSATIKNLSETIADNIPPTQVDNAKSLTKQIAEIQEPIKPELPASSLPETHIVSDLQMQLDQRAKEIEIHHVELPLEPAHLPFTNIEQELTAEKEEIENIDSPTPGEIIVVPAENWDEVKTNLIREESAIEEEDNALEPETTPESSTVAEALTEASEKSIVVEEDTNRPLLAIRPGKISMNELKDEQPAVKSEETIQQSNQIIPAKIHIEEEIAPAELHTEGIVVALGEAKEIERTSTPIEKLLDEIENITPEQELLIRVITGKSAPEQVPATDIVPELEQVSVANNALHGDQSKIVNEEPVIIQPIAPEATIESIPEPITESTPEPMVEELIATEPEQALVVKEEIANKITTPEISSGHFPEDAQAPKPANEDDGLGTLIYPVYTEDYFLQQGVKISKEIPKDLTHARDREKSLMVMMSFTEWLLHFKNTSDKQKEEKKDQKSLKTMWQKEKLAAAMEEENEEIPENVFEMAVNSITREDGLASESLADIYIKQKKYDQAIEMYRKLSLRNPKKYAYFARKIEEILKEKQS